MRHGLPHNASGNTLSFVGDELGTFAGPINVNNGVVPYRVKANDVYFEAKTPTIVTSQTSLVCLCHGPAGTLAYFLRNTYDYLYHTTDFFATPPVTVIGATMSYAYSHCFIYLPNSGIYLSTSYAAGYRYSTDALKWTTSTGSVGTKTMNAKFAENADGSIILSIGEDVVSPGAQGAIRSVDKAKNWTWSGSGFTSNYPMFYIGPWFVNGQFRILTKQGASPTTEGPIRIMSSADGVAWTEGPDLTSAFANFTPAWGLQDNWSTTDGQDAYLVGQRKDGAMGITILPNKYFA
jgi:hypothetical protein